MWKVALPLAVCCTGLCVLVFGESSDGSCQTLPPVVGSGDGGGSGGGGGYRGECGQKTDEWWTEKGIHKRDHVATLKPENFQLVTVATNETDGYKRFARSAGVYNVPVTVLGMGEKWLGGDMNYAGGGHKINLLREHLEQFKDDPEKVVLFTDSYDVMVLGGVDKILAAFERLDARVVFSAEGFCWPDATLASKYPPAPRGKRYLNSGGFIGYAPELYKIVTNSVVGNKDDDQLFYTKIYLDQELRVKLGMKLDHKAEIFQNLNGAVDDVELRFDETSEAYVVNTASGSTPLLVHGNGPSKLVLNTLGNYLARGWNNKDGCVTCWDSIVNLNEVALKEYPTVLVAIFIENPTPFLEEFLEKVYKIDYPKKKLHLFVHNNVEFHSDRVDSFVKDHGEEYRSVKMIDPKTTVKDAKARSLAMDYCITKNCAYYFNLDSEAHLDNPNTLKLLVEQNRSIIAPVLLRPGKLWSNFWGAITADGFYARSLDYLQIVGGERRGVWNVPYIRSCYLINATVIASKEYRPSYERADLDSDMSFCNSVRNKEMFMYVSNRFEYGHLVDNDNFDITKFNPEVYEIITNRYDWEQRYIHENYTENLNPNKTTLQPCPDVYWYPVVTERFCREFVAIMENFGKWSDGTNSDERLDGGYENVPTRDIHMKQVGLEPMWMEFLKEFVRPMQELIFTGYFHNPPRSLMNFVVRYRPDEQPSLRPHHDSSTYTINLALNKPHIDYTGGGCRFLRYNCSVTDTRMGWLLMHPGRLTHYHEGLQVMSGTRYIMISFVDP